MTYATRTKPQQANYKTLLAGMVLMYGEERFDTHFQMGECQYDYEKFGVICLRNKITCHGCDTSACLLGHGPIFGIGASDGSDAKKGWDWYAKEYFGAGNYRERIYDFMFTHNWSNDIQEAVERLRMYINGFNPASEQWHYSDRYSI